MIHILLVDDEPHVLDAIGGMLKDQKEYICQLHTADSAAKALNILKTSPIDLLISDICMPGLSGMDLAACVARIQPKCKLIFLSAYSNFSYAYEAIKYGALDYILKTEQDNVILQSIFKALAFIEADQKKAALSDSVPQAASLMPEDVLFATIMEHSSLTLGECAAIFRTLGFENKPAYLICVHAAPAHSSHAVQKDVLCKLIENSFLAQPFHMRSCSLGDQALFLLQFSQQPALDLLQISRQFSSILRLYTGHCSHAVQVDIVQLEGDYAQIREADDLIQSLSAKGREAIRCFSLAQLREITLQENASHDSIDTLISFIRSYIGQHINEEITLDILAQKTGYSADYLSVIFKQRTGESYHRFLCRQKMQYIKALMQRPELSLDDVCTMAGFKTRSYFNHFIKKEAAMPPRQLRNTLLKK